MLGMIKKDIFMIRNNLKTLLLAIIIYFFYTMMFDMDMSFILPFMIMMICISTFSYDDYNNWHSFATTLPKGKINIVKSKYITTIVLTIIATIISMIVTCIISNFKTTVNFSDAISSISGYLFAIFILVSILFPFLFKYGAEKGRIVMFILGMGIFAVFILLKKVINISIPTNIITFFDSYGLIIFLVLSVIFISVSYLISKKIYLKKEF
jgi:hypothetical protein